MDMAARLPLQSNQKKIRVPSGGGTVPVGPFVQPLTLKFSLPAANASEDTFEASIRWNCFAWKCRE